MSDRIRTLLKRISETDPRQTSSRQALYEELSALRRDLEALPAPDRIHCLDAALLLMEFMRRSEDVATAQTLEVVAGLVSTLEERVRPSAPRTGPAPVGSRESVTEHRDLRLAQDFLLGNILVQASMISTESLGRALQLHSASGLALGRCLVHLGVATPEQIASAVAFQDGLREEERPTRAEPQQPHRRQELRPSPKQKRFVQTMHANVLGEVLVRLGVITPDQLEGALRVQLATDVRIGEALVETGVTTWEQIKRGLEIQKQLRSG